jgi:hypothetical protein
VLAVSLKKLEHAALGVGHAVHQLEQRQIAQLGMAVKVALRENIKLLHNDIRSTSGLKSQNFLLTTKQ